jgi:hypothetical protein
MVRLSSDSKRMQKGAYNKWNSTDEMFGILKTVVMNAHASTNVLSAPEADVHVARSTVSWYQKNLIWRHNLIVT